jgi:hypothetical protein
MPAYLIYIAQLPALSKQQATLALRHLAKPRPAFETRSHVVMSDRKNVFSHGTCCISTQRGGVPLARSPRRIWWNEILEQF